MATMPMFLIGFMVYDVSGEPIGQYFDTLRAKNENDAKHKASRLLFGFDEIVSCKRVTNPEIYV